LNLGIRIKTKIILFTLFLVFSSSLIVGAAAVQIARFGLDPAQYAQAMIAVIVLTFIAVIIVTLMFAYQLIRPVDDLIIGTQLVAEGTLDHEISKNSDDEIGRLVDSFNRMTGKLRKTREQSSKFSQIATVEKQKAELIIDSMADSVIVTDAQYRVVLFNPSAERLFELQSHKVLGKSIMYLLKAYNIHHLFADFPDTKEGSYPQRNATVRVREFDLLKPEKRVIRATVGPLMNEGRLIIGTVIVLEDITKQRELDDMKTEFVSTVSHELRTPLTSIRGYAALLAEGRLGDMSEQQKRSAEIINKESDRLTTLINDILDLSRMESGKARTTFTFTNIVECLEDSPVLVVAQNKGIEIRRIVPANLPQLLIDKTKITQVFTNLLSNAVKFSKSGGNITIRITNHKDAVRIDIADNGIGIPKKEMPRLFNKFYQVESHLTRAQGGTGLGLPIVKEIIGLHHGLISIKSVLNKGTTVSFSLPKHPLSKSDLLQCWQAKDCHKTQCVAYESGDKRCWLYIGNRCKKNSNEPCLDKIEICSDCDIYQRGLDRGKDNRR
jgi:PAS domain S-box-containing protein